MFEHPLNLSTAAMSALHDLDLRGRTLLITGGSGGIGRAVLDLFVGLGAVTVNIDAAEGAALKGSHESYVCDLTDSTELETVARRSPLLRAGVDFLVLNAGIFPEATLASMSFESWRQVLAVNLDSNFLTLKAISSHLNENASIVGLTSIAAHRGSLAHAHYAASKAGLAALLKSVALELAPRGIRANCVSPGPVLTSMIEPLLRTSGAEILKATPLSRFARPEEIATVVLFLCSGWSSFMTGQVLHVNGGQYIPA